MLPKARSNLAKNNDGTDVTGVIGKKKNYRNLPATGVPKNFCEICMHTGEGSERDLLAWVWNPMATGGRSKNISVHLNTFKK